MDKPVNSGSDVSRVQTTDDHHHDVENMYSRIRKRRSNEICESSSNDDQHHEADNIYKRVYKRLSKGIVESSTTNETTSMSNVQTAANTIDQLKATNSKQDRTVNNTSNQSNATNSTEDPLAIKKAIIDLGKKYGETIARHKKASAEVKKAKRSEKSHKEKLEELVLKKRVCQNQSKWDSYSRRIRETFELIRASEEDIKRALETEESTKDDMETAEAEWKFEAMCSGEAYYKNGEWKWRN
ncbi:hypothetical protein L5515_017292 [Caenorhabditis briggsae]|uniref:Uncharacterized protein n=1 Tax=Caenorhabditis briggsae TaxID=6238 RepID=A0AAE9FJ57_CAEBR|nr:hypothetical protein L5515_017292 [Caenorhabditis briggsae]